MRDGVRRLDENDVPLMVRPPPDVMTARGAGRPSPGDVRHGKRIGEKPVSGGM